MEVAERYAPIFTTDKQEILLWSGRDAGKSYAIAQKIVSNITSKREQDVVVTRANYNSLKGTLFSEILGVIAREGLNELFKVKTFPLEIYSILTDSYIYFMGIGGSDLSRSKGFKPYKDHRLSLIVIDELQQLPTQTNLDQARATFLRHLAPNGQTLSAFNPEPQNSHWANEYRRMRENDPDWLVIHSSYLDIADKLTKLDLENIRKEKIHNEIFYNYLYMGETKGLFGSVYATFDREKHLVSDKEVMQLINQHQIYALIIGVDGATTRDATAFIPIIVLRNGQGIVLEYFYHNPQKSGTLSNEQLFPYVNKWVKWLENKYKIKGNVNKYMSIDPAGNSDLRAHLNFKVWSIGTYGRYEILPFTSKNIVRNAQIVQNGFSRNALLVKDSLPRNWVTGISYTENVLVTQLESVIWNEKGTKFDDTVPNDTTDALTYGFNLYYKNPHNLYAPKAQGYYEKGGK